MLFALPFRSTHQQKVPRHPEKWSGRVTQGELERRVKPFAFNWIEWAEVHEFKTASLHHMNFVNFIFFISYLSPLHAAVCADIASFILRFCTDYSFKTSGKKGGLGQDRGSLQGLSVWPLTVSNRTVRVHIHICAQLGAAQKIAFNVLQSDLSALSALLCSPVGSPISGCHGWSLKWHLN